MPGMGAMGVAETGTAGTEETGVVGTAETGTEGVVGIGATGAAGAVIPTPAAISGPSEVSASGEISMQMKCKCRKKKKGKGRYIPMKSGSGEALPFSSELEILFFNTGASSGSSKMSSDPSEDKFGSGSWVAEPSIKEGVTTSEALPFAAWEIAAKGSLVEITSGRTGEVVLA